MTNFLRALFTTTLLVVSVFPIIFAYGYIEEEYRDYSAAYLERDPLPVPALQTDGFDEVPSFAEAIPVLQYHGINPAEDRFSVSRETFAEHMAMLDEAGFETISLSDFAAAMDREAVDLPERPVLITFDDGRIDSYRGAHEILERYDFSAVMFAIAGTDGPFYLNWDELRAMDEDDTWEVQLHAGEGHQNVTTNEEGDRAPYYANRIFAEGRLETFEHYKERVSTDLEMGVKTLEAELPDYEPFAFAVPYGDAGDEGSNDDRILDFFTLTLQERFPVVFGENSRRFTTRSDSRSFERIELFTHTSADDLYARLAAEAERHRVARSP